MQRLRCRASLAGWSAAVPSLASLLLRDCKTRAPRLTAAWAATGQTEFVRRCFQEARQANPQATLLINDYRVDPQYVQLIEKLVDENGKPLYDVIGIQSQSQK